VSQPELDWSLEDAPPADEPPPPPFGGPPARRPPPDPAQARRALRRWLTAALLLALFVALGAWLFTQVGWRRLRDQVTAEVLYEDEHARAGEVELVLAVQADSADHAAEWRERRGAEAALGLAAPLPAAHLAPIQAPPVVESVEALGNDLFQATVVRAYQDSAGRPATFALPQRYRNIGRGLWERLPPDLAALDNTTVLAGERLSVTLPVADLPWLSDSLFAADALLVQACADWGDACQPNQRLVVRFVSDLGNARTVRPPGPGAAAGLGPYPAAFDLVDLTPAGRVPLVLLSPHLAGLPRDDGARQALTHALAAHGLAYLANAIARVTAVNINAAFFRDALVARAELRLGLAPAPTYAVRGAHYLPLAALWASVPRPDDLATTAAAARPADLPFRLLALNFLEAALHGQPSGADAVLLRNLIRFGGVGPWLDMALGTGAGQPAVDAWQAGVLATLDGADPLDWSQVEGLVYTCGDETYLIRAGQPLRLPEAQFGPGFLGQPFQALSPDGRYLAYVGGGEGQQPALFAYDLERGVNLFLAQVNNEAYVVGWSAGGALVTLERLPSSSPNASGIADFRAVRTDLASGQRAPLASDAMLPSFLGMGATWTPDRGSVLLNGYYGPPDREDLEALSPVLLPVDSPGPAWRLPRPGYGGLLSPDGQRLAYSVPVSSATNVVLAPVEVYDRASQTATTLLSAGTLVGPDEGSQEAPTFLIPAAWTPDGNWLLVMAFGENFTGRLLAVPAAGGPPVVVLSSSEGFFGPLLSPDGRYLAYIEAGQSPASSALQLIDLAPMLAGDPAPPVHAAAGVTAAAWSPDGRLIALAGVGGLRVLDPANGALRWVALQPCQAALWQTLGR